MRRSPVPAPGSPARRRGARAVLHVLGRLPRAARRRGSIPGEMIAFANRSLQRIRWSRSEVERFLGEYLSEPKPHVVFSPATRRRAIARSVVRLDPKTRMLYRGNRFFINGETLAIR